MCCLSLGMYVLMASVRAVNKMKVELGPSLINLFRRLNWTHQVKVFSLEIQLA